MKKKLLISGGHGSGEIAMSVFEDVNRVTEEWDIVGYLSDIREPGQYLGKHKVIGATTEIEDYVNNGYYIHNAIFFNAKDKKNRVEKFRELKIPLEANATAIHPSAYIMSGTKIGYGVVIGPYAATSFGPEIGNFVHIYTHVYIAHDAVIKDFTTITAHSIVGARVLLNEGAHIGLNACIREDLSIGKYSIIAMGAVVINDVEDFTVVAGNPAKEINKISFEKNK